MSTGGAARAVIFTLTLVGIILAALGCDREYIYRVEGRVKDGVTIVPIRGIQVECAQLTGEAKGSGQTDVDGNYVCEVVDEAFAAKEAVDQILITFEDNDGADNGGPYQSRSRELDVTDGEPYYLNTTLDPP